jgi:ribosomal-protein-alanine N-acetyltransferase
VNRLGLDIQLLTERCRLRATAEADLVHGFTASRVPGFNDGMTWDPPATVEEMLPFFRRCLRAWQDGTEYTFTIEDRNSAAFIGTIAIRSTPDPKLWNLGYWTHPTQQRKGYMTEVVRAVIRLGFDLLGAETIEACTATWNIASRKVLERAGLKEAGLIPKGFQKGGGWIPEYRLVIQRSGAATGPVSQPNHRDGRGRAV